MSLTIELADVMLPELQRVRADYRQDALPLSAGLYEAFLANGAKGRDALLCYLHLLWTYRRQGTDRPWAVSDYLAVGLKLSPKRVRLAKGLLCRMHLIEYVRDRKAGRLGKVYTKLNLVSNPGATGAAGAPLEKGPESTIGAVSPSMVPVQQVLEERSKRRVERPSAEAQPPSSPSLAKSKEARTPHGRVHALYSELYRKSTSAAGAPFNAACAGQLRNDLARLGEDRLARCLRWLFAHPPARMANLAYMALHTFLPEAETALAAEDRRLSMIRICPGCGKQQEHTGADCLVCGQSLKGAQHVG
jgi:hypothetical protein